jgi:uncharacterized integral membrane protein
MKVLRNVVAILALLILLILAFANAEPVRLTAFGYRTPELPLFIFLLVAFALGYLLAALVGAVKQAALNRKILKLERGQDNRGRSGQERANLGEPPAPGRN